MSKIVFGIAAIIVLGSFFAFSSLATGNSINNGVPATGSSDGGLAGIPSATVIDGVQQVRVKALSSGVYDVPAVKVNKGVPVTFSFSAETNAGCGKQLVLPDFNVQLVSRNGETVSATFTPEKDGVFAYRCGMNMFRGKLIVGEADSSAVVQATKEDSSTAGASCGKSGGCGCGGF